jgi:hypothetical protein
MAGGALAQLTASKSGSSGTVRNWHPKDIMTGGADDGKRGEPCHAYGQARASSFGSVHDDWKAAGPNLAPYPGSSGMMTGGAKRKNRKQTKKVGSKKLGRTRKTKKSQKQ